MRTRRETGTPRRKASALNHCASSQVTRALRYDSGKAIPPEFFAQLRQLLALLAVCFVPGGLPLQLHKPGSITLALLILGGLYPGTRYGTISRIERLGDRPRPNMASPLAFMTDQGTQGASKNLGKRDIAVLRSRFCLGFEFRRKPEGIGCV